MNVHAWCEGLASYCDSSALVHQIYVIDITHDALIYRYKAVLALSIMPKHKLFTLSGACQQSTLSTDFEVLQKLNASDLARAAWMQGWLPSAHLQGLRMRRPVALADVSRPICLAPANIAPGIGAVRRGVTMARIIVYY